MTAVDPIPVITMETNKLLPQHQYVKAAAKLQCESTKKYELNIEGETLSSIYNKIEMLLFIRQNQFNLHCTPWVNFHPHMYQNLLFCFSEFGHEILWLSIQYPHTKLSKIRSSFPLLKSKQEIKLTSIPIRMSWVFFSPPQLQNGTKVITIMGAFITYTWE